MGPAYLRHNSALRYRSAQTRLFGVHKEQQGASREKFDAFSIWRLTSFFVKMHRNY
jgi:hypothetical protein